MANSLPCNSGGKSPAYFETPRHERMSVELSTREQQVLRRIAEGKTSKKIAAELGIRLRTVNTHREHLAKKLGNSSVATFVRYAIEHGLAD